MWAGGKNRMLKKYQPFLPESFDKYVEPFFGGGAMFLWAYEKNPDASFVINDINKHIVQIYKSVRDDHEHFCETMDRLEKEYLRLKSPEDIPTNKELQKKHKMEANGRYDWNTIFEKEPSRRHFYFRLRDKYAWNCPVESWPPTFEAAVLYFLMKTGFNGLWQINKNTNGRFGTPAGLLNQKDKVYDKKNVLEWHKALQKCTIISDDFATVVSQHVTKDTFLFMDPPYRKSERDGQNTFTQYGVDFNDREELRVLESLRDVKKVGAIGWLSNRDDGSGFWENNCGEDFTIHRFDTTYTAGRRKKVEMDEKVTYKAKKAVEVLITTKEN